MIFPISGSKFRGKGGGLLLVTQTSGPNSFNANAISRPIAPPPTTTAFFDFSATSLSSFAFSGLVTTCTPRPKNSLAPGMGKMIGWLPVDNMRES